jgi:zinc transporter ZupT
MCIVWYRRRHNFVWLLGNIFIPGMFNGLIGVISTFAGIYGSQNGSYSLVSKVTLGVTGGSMVICAFLAVIYTSWKLRRVKRDHERKMEQANAGGN